MTYYLDLVETSENQLNQIVAELHKMHLIGVGLAFPEWGNASVGGVVRCCTISEDILFPIKYNQALEQLADNDLIIMHPIRKVPEIYTKVRYIRDRNREKFYTNPVQGTKSNYLEREAQRCLAAQNLERTQHRINYALSSSYIRNRKQVNYIKFQSLSTKQSFSLNIRREVIDERSHEDLANSFIFNSYGLARASDDNAGYVYEW